jgi:hypothetical protein
MNERWIPHFLGMLKAMQRLGSMGSSREVTFYSDGDGDYRPKFDWSENSGDMPEPVKPTNDNYDFDAG